MPEITIVEAKQILKRVVSDDRFASAFQERWSQGQDFSTDELIRGWHDRKCRLSAVQRIGEPCSEPIRIAPEDIAGIPVSDDIKEAFAKSGFSE